LQHASLWLGDALPAETEVWCKSRRSTHRLPEGNALQLASHLDVKASLYERNDEANA
jgi:hypothetical protein